MAGFPSNLAKKFSPTEQFPQHILPLLSLYNAQWWGYESLTTTVLVQHTLHLERCYCNFAVGIQIARMKFNTSHLL